MREFITNKKQNYLKSEAALAKRGDFEAFLDAVPNTPVEIDTDKIG